MAMLMRLYIYINIYIIHQVVNLKYMQFLTVNYTLGKLGKNIYIILSYYFIVYFYKLCSKML